MCSQGLAGEQSCPAGPEGVGHGCSLEDDVCVSTSVSSLGKCSRD